MARPCPHRFVAAVLDGPAPTDLDSPFVVRELLRRFLEEACTPGGDADTANVEVSECLAGNWRGFGPPSRWRSEAALGAYVLHHAGVDTSGDEPEAWEGLGTKISGALCVWEGMIHDIMRAGLGPRVLSRSLDWMCALMAGTLDRTHPGQSLAVASFIQPAGR